MISTTLIEKLEQLSPELQRKIEDEVDVLLVEKKRGSNDLLEEPNIGRGYGSMKNKIWMADDFDAPLDGFKEYI
ncbi:DUF2281 domain-containing protein [Mucilaginibacter galii]|uniref:DUF2281 domain-containing protein n=1 Tax=Mucilaginibacter galii TaxID=2005073 RepID=A0A917J5N3_9SPHI|nr:DUF2281 domain-containing protein [Mucilaginibacter galii]GGI49645.1 hypothetical protein GCM10011425_08570 [Mucilaginibacter galii]